MSLCLPYIEKGVKSGRSIVLVAGFPDDQLSGWGSEIPLELGKEFRLIFLCFPGYDDPTKVRKWGHDFPEILTMMHLTLEKLDVIKNTEKFFLIGHDWGSALSLMYQNKYPQHVEKIVQLDLTLSKSTEVLSQEGCAVLLAYQWWFALAYLSAQLLGKTFGRLIFHFSVVVLMPLVSPLVKSEKIPRKLSDSMVNMGYPYYYVWKGILSSSLPPMEFPTCPLLFMYGKKKRCMFHTKKFLEKIDLTEGSSHKSIIDAGHWLMVSHPEIVINEIKSFFSE